MKHNPIDFFARYTEEDTQDFSECIEAVSIVGDKFGLDYETVYSFAHTVWGNFKNYQTGISLMKQAMRYCIFLSDLPDNFVRPALNMYGLCEMFGFDVRRPVFTTAENLSNELTEVDVTLKFLRTQIARLQLELNPPIPCN